MRPPGAFRLLKSTSGRFVPGIESRKYAPAVRIGCLFSFGAIALSIAIENGILDKDGSQVSNSAGGKGVLKKSETIHRSSEFHPA